MFKNPFSFRGRIRRTEFCLSIIIFLAVIGATSFITDIDNQFTEIVFFMVFITVAWFLLAQGTKRCHDRGNSGFYMFIPFYRYWMMFADSDVGENYYGPNPKGIGNYESLDEFGEHLNN